MSRKLWRSQSAFTLIELLVVVLIIGILIAVSAPAFLNQTQKAHDSATKQYLTIAYKGATAAAVDTTGGKAQGDFVGGSYTTASLAAEIQSSEPELTVTATAPGSDCPAVALGQPDKNIYIDSDNTAGNSLVMCADPNNRVWTLVVANGKLQGFNQVYTGSSSSSSAAPATATISTGTINPDSGNTNTDCFLDCGWVGTSGTTTTSSNPTVIIITIPPGNLPTGTDPSTLIFTVDGTVIPPCTTPGVASPDPCVDSVTTDSNNNVVAHILTTKPDSHTYHVHGPSAPPAGGPNGVFTGDTPNNASGAPANDDFSNATILSGNSGVTTVTLTGATIENNNGSSMPENDGTNNSLMSWSWNGVDSESVWYAWQAPSSGVYQFNTQGASEPWTDDGTANSGPPFIAVWEGTHWPTATGYPSSGDLVLGNSAPDMAVGGNNFTMENQDNYSNGNGGYDTQVKFTATASHWYAIEVTNVTSSWCNGSCPSSGSFPLHWSTFVQDTDGDGIPDSADNCPQTPNPSQTDTIGPNGSGADGIGDACQTFIIVHNNSDYTVKFPYTLNMGTDRSWTALNSASTQASDCAAHSTCSADAQGGLDMILTGTGGSSQQVSCSQIDYTDSGTSSSHGCNDPGNPPGTPPPLGASYYATVSAHNGIGTQDTQTAALVWNTAWPFYAGGPIEMTISNYP